MTIPSTTRRAGPYYGTGALVGYSFSFKTFSKYDLAITVANASGVETPLVVDSTALVTLNADQDVSPGGVVYYAVSGVATALPVGYSLGILSDMDYAQATDLPEGGSYRAQSVEDGLDALAIQIQQISERVDRTVGLSLLAGDGVSNTLPVPVPNKHLGWNATGTALVNVDAGSGGGGGGGVGDVLSTDLLNTTNPAKGAGMLGYGPNVAYPAGTVGAELRTAQSQAEHFWRAVRNNQRDVYVIVTGDSTGNENTEWVYLMAQWLATQCPTHTVKYRLFNDGTTSWDSYTTLQTGSGPALPYTVTPFTIYVDNGSVSGTNTFYTQGARESSFWTGNDYDLVFVNYGHNLGTAMTEAVALPEWTVALAHVRAMAPRAGLLVTLQNPRSSSTSDINTNGSAQSSRMVAAWRKAVELIGAGVVDVYTAFNTHADYASLMADETHPNSAGSAVWLNEVKRVMAEPVRFTGDAPMAYNPLAEQRPNYAPNPRFSTWTGSTPDSWTFSSCTASKDLGVTDGSLYSLRITCTGGTNPQVTADLSAYLKHLRGKTVSFCARVWRPSGLGLLGGRIEIASTDSVSSSSSFVSYPRGTPSQGGWEWAMATLTIPRAHTLLTLRIYAGAADGSDNGESLYVDSVWFGIGWLPGQASLETVSSKFVLDYYGDGNVGLVSTTTTGSVTASSGTITLTGATSPNSGVYINLPGLTTGKTYKVTFNPVSCVGNTAGGVYARNGFAGGFTDLSKASGTGDWTVGGGTVTFTIVAPSNPVSLWAYGYTGATDWVMNQWSIKPVESGIARAINIPLLSGRASNSDALSTAGAVNSFGVSSTPGTSLYLIGANASSSTVTANALWEVTLPNDYVAGRDLTLTVNAYASGGGTLGATKSLTLTAYKNTDSSGAQGSNLGPSAATLTTAAADYPLTITGTTLSPGDRVLFKLSAIVQETAAGTLAARINSLRLS